MEYVMNKKIGFTLAEVLITLAIIGVVAAMTIPTLIAKINDIVTENQAKVFNAKLIKGLNLTKTAGDLNDTYTSTYDFLVNGLGKNLKMAKICDASHIRDCVPYNKITYTKNETEESINVSELNASKLRLDDRQFKDIAAFVLGDGTPAIVSYNLKCIDDPDKADTEINSCLAGIYDLNGTRKPNKLGKDLVTFNGAGVDGAILATVGGVKLITDAKVYDGITTSTYCDTSDSDTSKWTVKPEYSSIITKCCISAECQDSTKGDRWAASAIACREAGGKLPTQQQLADIANALYPGMNASASDPTGPENPIYGTGNIGTGTTQIPTSLSGLGSSWYLWSTTINATSAYSRDFYSSYTVRYYGYRNYSNIRAVCVE